MPPVQHTLYKKLSYRKQIARKLRTQYIYSNSLTLKSRLGVTRGHWKWHRLTAYEFLLAFHSNYGAIWYRKSQYITNCWSNITKFLYHTCI